MRQARRRREDRDELRPGLDSEPGELLVRCGMRQPLTRLLFHKRRQFHGPNFGPYKAGATRK